MKKIYKNQNIWGKKYLILEKGGPKVRAVSLITGIDSSSYEFILGPLKIRPFNSKTDSVLRKERPSDPQRSVLELNYKDYKSARGMYLEPMNIIQKVFRTIQILIDNWVGMSITFHLDPTGKIIGESGSTRSETSDTQPLRKEGVLRKKGQFNKKNFLKIYKVQNQFGLFISGKSNPLGRALDRFSIACSEIKKESILDFVIVLDGILGYHLDTEISHRVAIRGALLLSNKDEQKIHYYNLLKYLYKIRSLIAHGNEIELNLKQKQIEALATLNFGKWEDVPKFYKTHFIADVARRITRETLLEFINKPSKLSEEWLLNLELGK